jgi:hypothetical protein
VSAIVIEPDSSVVVVVPMPASQTIVLSDTVVAVVVVPDPPGLTLQVV